MARAEEERRRKLSVVCMTAAPAARVAALVRLYRGAADDVFVAVDDRAPEEVAGAAAAAGARVALYPYAEPVDRPLAWLHSQCESGWVLTVDDDEVPSPALLHALPRLVERDDVSHYWVPRRWVHPTPDTYLDEQPWRPDYQLRLVRNDPRLLRFFEETHRPIDVVGPGRYLEHPLYHADCVLNSRERRAAKAAKYERLRPGKRFAGGAMSHVLYLPELRPHARLATVPAEDREAITVVLDASETPRAPAGPAPRRVAREEIDTLWVGRELGEGDYRAGLRALQDLRGIVAGEQRTLDVAVTNRGSVTWGWGEHGRPEIRVSYRWRTGGGRSVGGDGLRTPFPADVAPGEGALLPVHVVAPADPGRYVLELDLVHEHVRWFGCGTTLDVDVLPRLRVALAGAGPPLEGALARLADAAPQLEPVVLARGDYELPPLWGQERAPAADEYLLHETHGARAVAASRLARRTAALAAASRRGRDGGVPPRLPRGGRAFVVELARARLLVLVPGGEPDTRGLWATAATVLAAGAAGVPVVVEEGVLPRGGSTLDRALARLVRSRAAADRLEDAVAGIVGAAG